MPIAEPSAMKRMCRAESPRRNVPPVVDSVGVPGAVAFTGATSWGWSAARPIGVGSAMSIAVSDTHHVVYTCIDVCSRSVKTAGAASPCPSAP
ncbi:hypothetical protein GCM10009855_26030 [Gordonia cholesterolivorans]|uniref:Uncharacterized protein n=1 Tax=Gordonia cholesterolivorans TaxID=559625 RepID=A0ABN3HP72_9ACTN